MTDFERKGFADVEALIRDVGSEDLIRVAPPATLWDRIDAEVSAGTSASARHDDERSQRAGAPAGVISLAHRRRNRMVAVALGAAAALVVAVAGVVVVTRDGDDGTIVARAVLTHEAQFDQLGTTSVAEAELIEDNGNFSLQIVDADLPTTLGEPADLEVWLIEPDDDAGVADLVSLGLVDPSDPGTFAVPEDYDPATYFVVDISVEPRDGVATHSGRSILRGPLQQS